MIRSFADRDTQRLNAGHRVRRFVAIEAVARRKLLMIDAAARLAVYFGTSEAFWINLQAQHDARVARRDLRPAIEKQLQPHAA